MNTAPGTEVFSNLYSPDEFQAFAIDVWDGNESQVSIFAGTSVTYPILMYGGQAGILSDYNCGYSYFFIIGGDDIIKWRGSWDPIAIATATNNAIAELSASPVPDVPASGHQLLANYPNPFNPMTRIPYELAAGDGTVAVQLDVLDVRGRLVKTLVQSEQTAGLRYEVMWDGSDTQGRQMPSGTYLSQLRIDGTAQSRFLTLVK